MRMNLKQTDAHGTQLFHNVVGTPFSFDPNRPYNQLVVTGPGSGKSLTLGTIRSTFFQSGQTKSQMKPSEINAKSEHCGNSLLRGPIAAGIAFDAILLTCIAAGGMAGEILFRR